VKRVLAALVLSTLLGASDGYVPEKGFVPDAETAKRIAEAVFRPVYGSSIEGEKPLKATLSGDVWTVSGTLPANYIGGVAVVKIFRRDGRVLYMMHGK